MAEYSLDSFFPKRSTLLARFPISPVNTLLHIVAAALSCIFIGMFLVVALMSLGYPFQLEWMEGSIIDIVQRVREGLPVYAKPSLDYVPFPYTPLYFYVSAAMSWLTGVDFLPARLVSLLSAIGILLLIGVWVRKEGGSQMAALIGAGLFAASYRVTGRWFDIARVDSLFLLLTLAALYWFIHYRGWKNALIAMALMCAAFFTKQTAAIVFAPVLLAMLLADRQHALRVGITLAIALLFIIGILNVATDYWFKFFVFELQGGHQPQLRYIKGFWTRDLLPNTAITLCLSLVALAVLGHRNWRKGIVYASILAGLVLCSYAARVNWGSFLNVLMPAYAAFALFAGLLLARLRQPHLLGVVAALLCAQLVSMSYDPSGMIPDNEARQKGEKFLKDVAAIEGDVLIPERQFVQTRVGKRSYTLGMAAYDLFMTDMREKNSVRFDLEQEIADAIAKKRFSAIIPGGLVVMPDLKEHYMKGASIDFPQEYVTGATNFLRKEVFVPRPDNRGPLNELDFYRSH